jgi:hypothetical protein
MADYKELLRRAVEALPENNGQARRAVYEKARAALVGQLRAIAPPLAARDITTHRLQLEDCIRQVEQEASEAVIAGMHEHAAASKAQPKPAPKPEAPPAAVPTPATAPEPPPYAPASIEEIIAAADKASASAPVALKPAANKPLPGPRLVPAPEPLDASADDKGESDVKPEPKSEPKQDGTPPAWANGQKGRPLPSIVARAEAARAKSSNGGSTIIGLPSDRSFDGGRHAPSFETRRDSGPRLEPAAMRGQLAARQQVAESIAYVEQPTVAAAMSSVREVEVEPAVHVDPQGAIDRAIATLDREARGETAPETNGNVIELPQPDAQVEDVPRKRGLIGNIFRDRQVHDEKPVEREERQPVGRREQLSRRELASGTDPVFKRPQAEAERGGISALTIFLTVFALLLVGAGSAGFWAWREGYINLDSMFARGEAVEPAAAAPEVDLTALAPAPETAPVSGPGNTATAEPNLAAVTPKVEERLAPAEPIADPTEVKPLALAPTNDEVKTEERLPGEDQATEPQTAEAAVAAIDPTSMAGSQSLLLEASDTGTTGAVPFSGTVDWSKGTDETGAPTLMGKASIPARNLTVDLLIRKNSDASLPASHLMEINFTVNESFIGGSIAGLPGVLLKNEELVQGAPLVGASARVVGNSFLFALSASPEDNAANVDLLTTRKWMDLAIIYATGKRAIITLEKDDAADALFQDVFAAWGNTASVAQ